MQRPTDPLASKNVTREKLLAAAIELFWLQSFGAVSVDDICKKAEVHKGSFYHFFQSKVDLAAAAFQTFWDDNRHRLDAAFSSALTPQERLRAYCELIYQHQKEKFLTYGKVLGCPFGACGGELANQEERIRITIESIFKSYTRYFETLLRDARAAGCRCNGAEADVAQEMVAYAEGVVQQAVFRGDIEIIRLLLLPGLMQYIDAEAAGKLRQKEESHAFA